VRDARGADQPRQTTAPMRRRVARDLDTPPTHQELDMKKTIQPRKLKLSGMTLRQLSSAETVNARGALQDTNSCRCPAPTAYTCSCKHSVCDSCYGTDCCLMEP
jgi:hypothetical protein